ncbi:2,5-diamino-6-(ribosylamino)-4(3H)-pyrimidinone 5'-phosphate reductase [[Eubacterium] cellulosolvens]
MSRPYVILGGFMSVDGKSAPANRKGRIFTPLLNEKLLSRLHKIRANVDAVLVGAETVIEDDPKLTVRAAPGNNPLRVVLDSLIRTSLESHIYKTTDSRTILAVCHNAPKDKINRLKEKGVEILNFDCERRIPLRGLLDNLHRKGVKRLLVEGGSEVRWSFIKERLVDEIFVWITPSIWGGRKAPTMVDGDGYLDRDHSLKLRLKNSEIIDDTVLLEYHVL